MEPPADPVLVGRIVRPRGIAGEVVVEPESGRSHQFEPGAVLWAEDRWMTVLQATPYRERWSIRFVEIVDLDGAERLRGSELSVGAEALRPLEGDEYYVHDLVGCRVESSSGRAMGTVRAVITGPRDWLEVEHEGRRALVPMARELLRSVDLNDRRIVVDAPEGLLEATAQG